MPGAGDRDIRPPGRGPVARTEFAVIGAGITGLSAAWALARRGREVTVLDQAGIGHLAGGSHGACRIFRLGYDDPEYVSLAGQARNLWTELEETGGERLLHPTPQLTFGPQMPQVRAAMRQAGADFELLTPGEAAGRFPGLRVRGEVLLEPDSAVIAADRALAALASLAGATGGIRTGVRATGLADDGRRILVSTTAGDIAARLVIVCAGPWTAGLLATGGVSVPGSATLEQVSYLAPATAAGAGPAPPMPIFVHYGGEFAYGLPVPGSEVYKIGIHHGGPEVDPGRLDQAADPGLTGRAERAARAYLPGCDPRPVAVERCVYDNSPDADFIVDRIGNVVIGTGTSGHGFKFGPLLGEWLASLALSARERTGSGARRTQAAGLAEVPARFALARFVPDQI